MLENYRFAGNPNEKKSETEIAERFYVHPHTVHTIRKEYTEIGLDATIHRKIRDTPPVQPKITGDVEARIIALLDNLNTHTISSLYEAFDPATARRLAKHLEIHYTPKHGSWLNIAEIELSAMSR